MNYCCKSACAQVEQQKPKRPHLTFHIVAKELKEPHIAKQVKKATMQKLGGNKAERCRIMEGELDLAPTLIDIGRHNAPVGEQVHQSSIAKRGCIYVDNDIHRNKKVSYCRLPFAWVRIVYRYHALIIAVPLNQSKSKTQLPCCAD